MSTLTIQSPRWGATPRILIAAGAALWFPLAGAEEAVTAQQALAGTKPIVDLRLRHENVDETGLPEEANADTLRARLGFETGKTWAVSLLAEAELVGALDSDYNSTLNGNTQFPIIADPETEEMNRLQLTSTAIPDTTLILGRQRIIYDDHRFVGNGGWRQNEQTFDALRIVQRSVDRLTVDLTYLNQVNRVFGKDSPVGRFTGDNYLANVSYDLGASKLTGFVYLLDLEESPQDSSATTGLRLTHKWTLPRLELASVLSFATQTDRAANPVDYRDDYFAGELTATLHAWNVGGGIDLLQGDGVQGFTAPIGTLHRFQGWVDKFLVTPVDGIDDRYVSCGYMRKSFAGLDSISALAVYHRFDAQRTSLHYGSELDLMLQGTWRKFIAAITYADYAARGFATDTSKLWLQIEFVY